MLSYTQIAHKIKKQKNKDIDKNGLKKIKENNKENVIKLLNHERNKNVKVVEKIDRNGKKSECVYIRDNPESEWIATIGLLDQMKRIFFFDYNYYESLKCDLPIGPADECYDPVELPSISPKQKKKEPEANSKADGKMEIENQETKEFIIHEKERGKDLGIRVDKELYYYINSQFKSGKRSEYERVITDPCRETTDIIKSKKKWKWKPIVAQFPIYVKKLGIGTKVDEIDINEMNQLIVIDNKTGYKGYLTKANANMKGPLSGISNCPLNQHFLQVLLESIIIEKFWEIKVHEGYIIQILEEGIVPHRLPEWARKRKEEIWQYFCENMN